MFIAEPLVSVPITDMLTRIVPTLFSSVTPTIPEVAAFTVAEAGTPVTVIPVRIVPTVSFSVTVVELEVVAFTTPVAWSIGVMSLYAPPDSM